MDNSTTNPNNFENLAYTREIYRLENKVGNLTDENEKLATKTNQLIDQNDKNEQLRLQAEADALNRDVFAQHMQELNNTDLISFGDQVKSNLLGLFGI